MLILVQFTYGFRGILTLDEQGGCRHCLNFSQHGACTFPGKATSYNWIGTGLHLFSLSIYVYIVK